MHEAQNKLVNEATLRSTHENCRSRFQWRTDCQLCREALYQIWYDALANERPALSPAGGLTQVSAAFDALSTAIAMVEEASSRGELHEAMR
jgi:hypothetical protein